MQWYVYTYRRDDGTVYYVGKGEGGRCYAPKDHPVVPPKERIVLTYFDTEEEAWECERRLIAFWGRKGYEPYGVLLNDALGGPGRPGSRHSAETRAKLAAANKGKKHSAETRGKLSAANSGSKNPMYGKPRSAEQRAKIAAALKGRKRSAESIAKQSKTWIVTSPSGDSRVVRNLKQFCQDHGLHRSSMTMVAQSKQKQHKGWKVRYA